MKPSQFIRRKLGLWLFAAMLVVGFGVVVARSGPLSPIQVRQHLRPAKPICRVLARTNYG